MFLGKGVLKICSKFTEEHPCQSASSKALRDGCSPVNLLHIFRTRFPRNTSGGLFLDYFLPDGFNSKNFTNFTEENILENLLSFRCDWHFPINKLPIEAATGVVL